MRKAYQIAEENSMKVNAANKRRYDVKVHYRDLKPGNKVLYHHLSPAAKHKLADHQGIV